MTTASIITIWIGHNQYVSPDYETGRYWYKLQHSALYIRQFKKPNWLKRFCMEYFIGIEFIDTFKPKEQ